MEKFKMNVEGSDMVKKVRAIENILCLSKTNFEEVYLSAIRAQIHSASKSIDFDVYLNNGAIYTIIKISIKGIAEYILRKHSSRYINEVDTNSLNIVADLVRNYMDEYSVSYHGDTIDLEVEVTAH